MRNIKIIFKFFFAGLNKKSRYVPPPGIQSSSSVTNFMNPSSNLSPIQPPPLADTASTGPSLMPSSSSVPDFNSMHSTGPPVATSFAPPASLPVQTTPYQPAPPPPSSASSSTVSFGASSSTGTLPGSSMMGTGRKAQEIAHHWFYKVILPPTLGITG